MSSRSEYLKGIFEDDNNVYGNLDDTIGYANRLIDDFENGRMDKYLSRLERYQLAQSENNRNHNGVLLERQMIDTVKSGDLSALKKCICYQKKMLILPR